jgi:hypothetical protein
LPKAQPPARPYELTGFFDFRELFIVISFFFYEPDGLFVWLPFSTVQFLFHPHKGYNHIPMNPWR